MSVNFINKQKISALDANIGVTFNRGYANFKNDLVGVLYNEIKTTHTYEALESMDGLGLMREFGDERQPAVLNTTVSLARPVKYEKTIAVKAEDIEDDNLGKYSAMVDALAIASHRTPMATVVNALTAGFTTKTADNEFFFSDSHGNLQAGVLNATNLNAAAEKIAEQTDSQGSPLGLMADTLFVGPKNAAAAREILNAQVINGTTNVNYNAYKLVVTPYITDTKWFLADTKEGIKGIELIVRVSPDKIIAKNIENSDNAFNRDIYEWGTRGRFCAAYHAPKLMVGSLGVA